MTTTQLHTDLLTELRQARRADPARGWVHGQRLQGIAGNRYGARLGELRDAGWHITSKKASGGGGWNEYRLESFERGSGRSPRVSFDLPMRLIRQLAAGHLSQEVIAEARRLAPAEQASLFGGAA